MDNVTQIAQLMSSTVIAAGLVIGPGWRGRPPSGFGLLGGKFLESLRSPAGTHQHVADQDVHRRGPCSTPCPSSAWPWVFLLLYANPFLGLLGPQSNELSAPNRRRLWSRQ